MKLISRDDQMQIMETCCCNLLSLNLKAPITTAAEDKFCDIFLIYGEIRHDIS